MVYKDFQGLKLSALGLGAMRLPVIDGRDGQIDEKATEEMVDYAMAQGINYYDTAWGYHEGHSETVMGKCLRKYPRDSYYIATKFPGYDLSNMDKVEKIFEKQLEKTGMEYFDFYLFHNVCELNIDAYLDREKYGIDEYLMKQKANGRIRHLGFSIHGSMDVMNRFLDAYGDHIEFCQIQLNWLDWEFQDAKAKVAALKERGIPVWVMEPLRGGKLVRLADEDVQTLHALRPNETVPGWSFRFLQSIDNVTMTLSGMSSFQQLKDNIRTYQTDEPLNDAEIDAMFRIADRMTSGVPCTACRYCTTHCPKELDIPYLIELYNEHKFTGTGAFIAPMALMAIDQDKQPQECLHCHSCEQVCPQQIKISDVMEDFASIL